MNVANTLHLRPVHPWIKDAKVELYYIGANVFEAIEYWTPGPSTGSDAHRHVQLFRSVPNKLMMLVAVFSDGKMYVDGNPIGEPGDPADGKHAIDMFLFWEATK